MNRSLPFLGVAVLGLGAALLIPVAFSDPNGVDPYAVRLSATSLLVLGAAFASARLAAARPLLLTLAAITTTYTVLTAATAGGAPLSQVLWASLGQAALTIGFAVAVVRFADAGTRPRVRLRSGVLTPLLVSSAGIVLLVGLGLLLPATLLGREALQPVALGRDLPWLAPACALQAFAQELQFRGLLLGVLERELGPAWANTGQAAFFGLAHLAVSYGGPEAPFVPLTFLFGLLMGTLVQRTGSLWPAIVIHAVADIALTATVAPGLYGL